MDTYSVVVRCSKKGKSAAEEFRDVNADARE
jgi:hypothetical protein